MPLVHASSGIHYNDPVIAVAVGDIQLIGFRVHFHIRRPEQLWCAISSTVGVIAGRRIGWIRIANLVNKCSVSGKLEHHGIETVRRSPGTGVAITGAVTIAIAGDIDKTVVIDINTMFTGRPVASCIRITFRINDAIYEIEMPTELSK